MGHLAEKALAGVLMHKPQAFADVSGVVFKDDFADKRAAMVFDMAGKSFRNGNPFDLVIASQRMKDHVVWLAEAYDVIPINHVQYAKEINNCARLRRLREGLGRIVNSKYDEALDMLSDISLLHKDEAVVSSKNHDAKSVVDRTFSKIEKNRKLKKLHGISTGFYFLDDIYVRYIPGHMWVITGFTSTGKSTLLVEMLARIRESRVTVISTEMTEEQLVSRMVARETGFHNQIILSGRVGGDEYDKINHVMAEISSRKLTLIDNVTDINEIESIVNQCSMRDGVDVVFIDYVQQLRCKGVPRREWGAEIAERIQQLAKRANTCIVCFSQVSNEVGRGNVDQFEAKGAGEWAACADVGVRLRGKSENKYMLLFDMQKGRHFGTTQKTLQFMNNYTKINEQ